MRIPNPRSRLTHTLGYGLAALLAPALVAGCGPTETHATAPAATSAAPHTSAAPSSGTAAATPAAAPGTPSTGATSSTPSPTASNTSSTDPGPTPSSTPSPSPSSAPAASSTPAPPPASGTPTSIVRGTASGGRTVALTFDDGPGPATDQILDLLAKYDAHATFCQIGPQATARPATVKRILAEGHRLCDHTVDHPQPMRTLPHDRQVFEITAAKDMITKAGGTGTKVSWFRAPGGDFSSENELIAAQNGMRPLGWSVDPRDWARPGAAAIVANVEHNLKPGGVVLMHDGGGDRSQTVAALRQLLPWLTAQGYTFDFPAC
ncbi:polysaccharide deacetylase family protein [Kitasatospora sp. GP82]|uniref:polysaccharide deacetylase family protein n=1 Tax=Kitasatospora sp. GP82 TaxID=3035089 RepID=UPI002476595E|nr:polysaccharide deacetylase family protein [Kitasatospora sp. GP82]MDH6127108.1 peptidoglycan/xylan/chitin deacetylase (PgdA/CDA1 family) [Kitasatospora sp. GP82]